MRVLICGDRNWTDKGAILHELRLLVEDAEGQVTVIDGMARGADTLGFQCGQELGLQYERYPAQWDKYGRAAGPIRNQQMLDEGQPDLVVAFHDNLDASKGTKDMVTRARKAGVQVVVISH